MKIKLVSVALFVAVVASAGEIGPITPPTVIIPALTPVSANLPGMSRIAVVGDAGSADDNQLRVAAAMAAENARAPFASVLALGDNVYAAPSQENFDAAIVQPYASLFDGGARFFPVLGNHDVNEDDGEAQRSYWRAPRWYSQTIGRVKVIALDTTVIVPHHLGDADADRHLQAKSLRTEQLAWLERELEASAGRTIIVIGHHPMYVSTDDAGKVKEAAKVRSHLEALFQKHGVKLYLSGHKHQYERFAPVAGVTQVISGAGGQLSQHEPTPIETSRVLRMRRHFLIVEDTVDGLRVRAISENGDPLDEVLIP